MSILSSSEAIPDILSGAHSPNGPSRLLIRNNTSLDDHEHALKLTERPGTAISNI